MLVGQCHLNGVQIFTLDILHQCHLHHALVLDGADVGRNTRQSGYLRGTPTALTSYNLVFASFHLAQCDRLDDAYLTDAVCQFLQRLFVKLATGLVGIRLYQAYLYLVEVGTTLGLNVPGIYQRIKTASSTDFVESASQHASVVFLSYSHKFFFLLKRCAISCSC